MLTYCHFQYLLMLRSRVFVCMRVFQGQSMLKSIGHHFMFLEGSSFENAKSFALRLLPLCAHDPTC